LIEDTGFTEYEKNLFFSTDKADFKPSFSDTEAVYGQLTPQIQFTAFPQSDFTMCKTCEKHFFFARKVNADSNLQ